MTAALFLLAALAVPVSPTPTPPEPRGPTFCAEWIRQSGEGYERLTLFRNGVLIWKTSRGDRDEVKRETLEPTERDFYCAFFARDEFWKLPADLRTGLVGVSPRARPSRWRGRTETARACASTTCRAARPNPRPCARRWKDCGGFFCRRWRRLPASLRRTSPPGTLLKRFDGAVFRVTRLEKDTGFVEIAGVTEPYSQFVKIEELRFRFFAPDPRP